MAGLSSNKKQSTIFYKGFGMIEAVVGVTLASILLTAFMTLTVQTVKINRANINELKADMYLKELIEVAKDLEQSDWNELSTSTCVSACHPTTTANVWQLESGTELIDNNVYNRWLIIEEVFRNATDEIVVSTTPGAVLSTSTKKIITTITWNDGFKDASSTLETYVYD
jgi:type II secretory pathway pseudopilin PulG